MCAADCVFRVARGQQCGLEGHVVAGQPPHSGRPPEPLWIHTVSYVTREIRVKTKKTKGSQRS
eukprot:9191265-Lingulodinium_polyedra.AAC.1